MNNKIPGSHNYRSLRLKGYDYSGEGLYFITICTKDHQHFFGTISEGEMILNKTGCIAELFLREVSTHFSHAMVDEHVVMPNHVHLILVLNDRQKFADDDGLTGDRICHGVGTCHGVGICHGMGICHGDRTCHGVSTPPANLFGKPIACSVSVIINQYKSSVKRWCNKNGLAYFKWQSRFYDHIIRNEESCQNIVNYIHTNPKHWEDDKFYMK